MIVVKMDNRPSQLEWESNLLSKRSIYKDLYFIKQL